MPQWLWQKLLQQYLLHWLWCKACESEKGFKEGKKVKAVVTFRVPRMGRHDSLNKKSGWCPIDPKVYCTDVTGDHHSAVMEGLNMNEITNRARSHAKSMEWHVTRIEFFDKPVRFHHRMPDGKEVPCKPNR